MADSTTVRLCGRCLRAVDLGGEDTRKRRCGPCDKYVCPGCVAVQWTKRKLWCVCVDCYRYYCLKCATTGVINQVNNSGYGFPFIADIAESDFLRCPPCRGEGYKHQHSAHKKSGSC